MEIKEEWRTIEEYPDYMVSNMGNIKSLKYGKERVLKQEKIKNGYCRVKLHKEGKQKMYLVHRLVALHFIPNPQNLPEVNHKSEVKTENNVENLEWCSHTYNINFGTRNGRMSKPILQFSKSGNIILRKWESTHQVERELGINNGNIIRCCKGKLKTAGKYRWMYLEDYVNRMEKLYNLALKNVS